MCRQRMVEFGCRHRTDGALSNCSRYRRHRNKGCASWIQVVFGGGPTDCGSVDPDVINVDHLCKPCAEKQLYRQAERGITATKHRIKPHHAAGQVRTRNSRGRALRYDPKQATFDNLQGGYVTDSTFTDSTCTYVNEDEDGWKTTRLHPKPPPQAARRGQEQTWDDPYALSSTGQPREEESHPTTAARRPLPPPPGPPPRAPLPPTPTTNSSTGARKGRPAAPVRSPSRTRQKPATASSGSKYQTSSRRREVPPPPLSERKLHPSTVAGKASTPKTTTVRRAPTAAANGSRSARGRDDKETSKPRREPSDGERKPSKSRSDSNGSGNSSGRQNPPRANASLAMAAALADLQRASEASSHGHQARPANKLKKVSRSASQPGPNPRPSSIDISLAFGAAVPKAPRTGLPDYAQPFPGEPRRPTHDQQKKKKNKKRSMSLSDEIAYTLKQMVGATTPTEVSFACADARRVEGINQE